MRRRQAHYRTPRLCGEPATGVRTLSPAVIVPVAVVVEGGVLGEVAAELGEPELEPLREPPLVDLNLLFLQLVHGRLLQRGSLRTTRASPRSGRRGLLGL